MKIASGDVIRAGSYEIVLRFLAARLAMPLASGSLSPIAHQPELSVSTTMRKTE